MAIDMLEHSEMGALAQSRLGRKNFIDDDDRYANLSWVSKKEKRRRKESSIASVESSWGIDPKYANDCEYLQTRMKMLDDEIENQLSQNPSKVTMDRLVNPLKNVLTRYKNAITMNKCVERIAEAETTRTKKETIDALTQASATPPPSDGYDSTTGGSSNATKYVIYGVAGLTVVVILVALLRNK